MLFQSTILLTRNYWCEECRPLGHPYLDLFKPKKRKGKKRSTFNSRTADLFDLHKSSPSESDSPENDNTELIEQREEFEERHIKKPRKNKAKPKKDLDAEIPSPNELEFKPESPKQKYTQKKGI
jgi:hypothetical protein